MVYGIDADVVDGGDLGTRRIRDQVVESQAAVHRLLPFSLTFDPGGCPAA